MKVPMLQSQVSAPSSTGFTPQQGSNAGQAVSNFADTALEIMDNREKRNAEAMIMEGENQLRQSNRAFLMDAKANRRGRGAMASDDGSVKSVYDDYNEKSNQTMASLVDTVPKKYQQIARQRLSGVVNSGANTVASYQSGQEAIWREDTKKEAVLQAENDLVFGVENGDPIMSLDTALDEVERISTVYGSGANKEYNAIKQSNITASAISLTASKNAGLARQMLNTKKYSKHLSLSQTDKLNGIIEKEQDRQDAEGLIATAKESGADYQTSLELVRDSNASDDAKSMAVSQIKHTKAVNDEIAYEQSFKYLDILRDEILVGGNKAGYTPLQVETDPAFDMLTPQHKKIIQAWVKGDTSGLKAGQFEAVDKVTRWDNIMRQIDAGTITRSEILAGSGETHDVRDTKSLINYFQSHGSEGKTAERNAIQMIDMGPYRGLKAEQRSQIKYSALDDIQEWKAKNKGMVPSAETIKEIVRQNAEPMVDYSWWSKTFGDEENEKLQNQYKQILEQFPNLNKPQSELYDEGKKVPVMRRMAVHYRQNGWSQATPTSVDKRISMFLGEPSTPDGYIYYMTGDRRVGVPIGSDEANYILSLVVAGFTQ
jgi:hypothetical protein